MGILSTQDFFKSLYFWNTKYPPPLLPPPPPLIFSFLPVISLRKRKRNINGFREKINVLVLQKLVDLDKCCRGGIFECLLSVTYEEAGM